MELPSKPSPAKRKNPKKLVIFGKPKCGKTTISSYLTLSGQWLLVELEPAGVDFVEAMSVQINTLQDIIDLGTAVKKAGNPYDGLIVDTVTKLEELVLPLAAKKYKALPMSAGWTGTDVRTLPKGAGYLYLREAFFEVVEYLSGLSHNIIFLGHLSDKLIDKKGEEFSSKELDLTGKIKTMLCADVDAIAYCYRKDNQTILNFNSSEEIMCGARADHLKGQEIVIAESDKNGKLTTYWDRIYVKE